MLLLSRSADLYKSVINLEEVKPCNLRGDGGRDREIQGSSGIIWAPGSNPVVLVTCSISYNQDSWLIQSSPNATVPVLLSFPNLCVILWNKRQISNGSILFKFIFSKEKRIHLFSFFLVYITRTIYCVLHLLKCSISVKTRYYREETTTTTKKTDRGFADLGLLLILLHTSYIKKRKSHSLLLLKNKTAGITLNSNYIISLQ